MNRSLTLAVPWMGGGTSRGWEARRCRKRPWMRGRTSSSSGGGFGGLTAGAGARRRAGAHHAGRPHQPPPVPAPALPGGHGRAFAGRHRAADPVDLARAAQRAVLMAEVDALRPRRRGACFWPTARPRLRLPRRRVRRGHLLLRPRGLGALRAGAEDDRGRGRDPAARAPRFRARRARVGPGEARRADELRRHRRRTDGRRARRRAGGAVASSCSRATSGASTLRTRRSPDRGRPAHPAHVPR